MNDSAIDFVSGAEHNKCNCCINTKDDAKCRSSSNFPITDLPPEVLQLIFKNLSYDNIAKLRLVCRYFNNMCSSLLNSEFYRLRTAMQQRFHGIKAQMPRRESARRKHPLARESDIIETLHMRLSLLHMTFGKHIERKYCCFFPGEIIDEIHRILQYIENTPSLNRAYKVTDELFDLSTMAMEYFKEHIEPMLPEITYFTSDFLEYPSIVSSSKAQVSIEETFIAGTSSKRVTVSPQRDSVLPLYKRFRKLREIVKRNGNDIGNMKHSLKLAKRKVNSLEKEIQQLKWQQNDSGKVIVPDFCKINEILLELNRCKLELELVTSNISLSKCVCNISDLSTERQTSIDKSNESSSFCNKYLPRMKENQNDSEPSRLICNDQSSLLIPFIKDNKRDSNEKNEKKEKIIPRVSLSENLLMGKRNICVVNEDLIKKQKLDLSEFKPSTSSDPKNIFLK